MNVRGDVDDFVVEADHFARLVLAATDPYDEAMQFTGFCMSQFEVGDVAVGLYLIWGAMTDGVDGPRSDEFEVWAYDAMIRAASEWLALPRGDQLERQAYIDHWVHDECGYARTDQH